MDILKRHIAPLSTEAWNEIDDRAKDVLKSVLSARKAVHVKGPMGWDYAAVPEGRLEVKDKQESDIKVGTHKVKALVEARTMFELNKWELDNIQRGAKDINLDSLEEATKRLALYEEESIFNGNKDAGIQGLLEAANHSLKFGKSASDIMTAISEARFLLRESYAERPYSLIVGKEAYKRLGGTFEGYPLIQAIKDVIHGEVIPSLALDGALLVPHDHEDIELTIGQDFSIGYDSHTSTSVKFFITESFTFRTLDENIIVKFKI